MMSSVLLVPLFFDDAEALCMYDKDWPDKPCYGCPTCYPGVDRANLEWMPYYDYKGPEWMESKKQEMIQFVTNGTLSDWLKLDYSKRTDRDIEQMHENNENHNVWTYYYHVGEVPHVSTGKYVFENNRSPFHQLKNGIPSDKISCNHDNVLMKKTVDDSTACVKPDTYLELLKRGWGTTPLEETVIVQDTEFSIFYTIDKYATLVDIVSDFGSNSIILQTESDHLGYIAIDIPRNLVDAKMAYYDSISDADAKDDMFFVLVNGEEVYYLETATTSQSRTLLIPYPEGLSEIEIIGTYWI